MRVRLAGWAEWQWAQKVSVAPSTRTPSTRPPPHTSSTTLATHASTPPTPLVHTSSRQATSTLPYIEIPTRLMEPSSAPPSSCSPMNSRPSTIAETTRVPLSPPSPPPLSEDLSLRRSGNKTRDACLGRKTYGLATGLWRCVALLQLLGRLFLTQGFSIELESLLRFAGGLAGQARLDLDAPHDSHAGDPQGRAIWI